MTPSQVYINYVDQTVADVAAMVGLNPPPIRDLHEVAQEEVLQINIYVGSQQEKILMQDVFKHCTSSRWYPAFADLNVKGNSKSTGIDQILADYTIPLSDTLSVGDGGTDIPMLHHTGFSVAMGNADEVVKKVAKYVTTDCGDNGIYNAMKHFDLI